MMIQRRMSGDVVGAYQSTMGSADRVAPIAARPGTSRGDRVTLSEQGRELQQLLKTVRNAPDTREEKVRELQLEIQRGRYRPDTVALVKQLIQAGGL